MEYKLTSYYLSFPEGIISDGNAIEATEVPSVEVTVNTVGDELMYNDQDDADDDSTDGGKTETSLPCNMMAKYLLRDTN